MIAMDYYNTILMQSSLVVNVYQCRATVCTQDPQAGERNNYEKNQWYSTLTITHRKQKDWNSWSLPPPIFFRIHSIAAHRRYLQSPFFDMASTIPPLIRNPTPHILPNMLALAHSLKQMGGENPQQSSSPPP